MRQPDAQHRTWRKSSYSGSGENCVELGRSGTAGAVRDTKLGEAAPVLPASAEAVDALLEHLAFKK